MSEKFEYHELERAALSFILEIETWPVFLEWVRSQHVSQAAIDWVNSDPNPRIYQAMWMLHSPDADIRRLGGQILDEYR
jgi:hypothetical protein